LLLCGLLIAVFVFVTQVEFDGNVDQSGKAVKAGELLIIMHREP